MEAIAISKFKARCLAILERVRRTGEEVLVTGRVLSTMPWVVLRKVSTAEALADTDSRLTTMLVV